MPCDVFITEATFALPVFHHPSDAGEIGKLLQSLRTFPESTHLVGVYALGKCQRVITLLRASVATQVLASLAVLAAALSGAGLWWFLVPLVVALLTVSGVNGNGIALALDPFPKAAASAAALVGGLQMLMGALATIILSGLDVRPPVEMAVGMTAASSVSLAIVLVALLRSRAFAGR